MDGLLGVEAEAMLKCIASRFTQKWKELYSRTYRYMMIIAVITLVQATHFCVRGDRVTEYRISVTRPYWEDCADLHLLR